MSIFGFRFACWVATCANGALSSTRCQFQTSRGRYVDATVTSRNGLGVSSRLQKRLWGVLGVSWDRPERPRERFHRKNLGFRGFHTKTIGFKVLARNSRKISPEFFFKKLVLKTALSDAFWGFRTPPRIRIQEGGPRPPRFELRGVYYKESSFNSQ